MCLNVNMTKRREQWHSAAEFDAPGDGLAVALWRLIVHVVVVVLVAVADGQPLDELSGLLRLVTGSNF